jgi:hypothetical protein
MIVDHVFDDVRPCVLTMCDHVCSYIRPSKNRDFDHVDVPYKNVWILTVATTVFLDRDFDTVVGGGGKLCFADTCGLSFLDQVEEESESSPKGGES